MMKPENISPILKVFIAQAMDGVPDEEVEELRMKITTHIKDRYKSNEIEILDQFHIPEDELPGDGVKYPRIHMLGRSIQYLADVDLVVFYGDFTHSKGCSVELAVCKEYGIPYIVIGPADIDGHVKLSFEYYVVYLSNQIPEGKIYVSDANYDEAVIVTRFPFKNLLMLRSCSIDYIPDDYKGINQKYAVINYKTGEDLLVDMDGLGDVICISRPTPFHNWGLSKTGEPLIID